MEGAEGSLALQGVSGGFSWWPHRCSVMLCILYSEEFEDLTS